MEKKGMLEMLAAMAICGTIGITVHYSGQSPVSLIFYRCLFGAAILLAVCISRNYLNRAILTPKVVLCSLAGGVVLLCNWYFLFSAYSKTSIGIATTVYNTQPLIMVFLGWLLFKEKITINDLLWIVVSLSGLLFIADIGKELTGQTLSSTYLLGIAQALTAALFYAIATVFAKYLKGNPPTLIALLQMLLGTIVLWPWANLGLLSHFQLDTATLTTMLLGIFHTGLMYILLYSALQNLPSYKAASISFLYPAIALFIDATVLHISVSLFQWLGILLVLAGAAGINLKWKLINKPRPSQAAEQQST